MKTCPQCNIDYPDDYVFCLADGNTLLDESGEQETRLSNRIVFPEKTSALSPDMLVACSSCSLANRPNSKFCKKCGTLLSGQNPSGNSERPSADQVFGFGSFPSPSFSPPQTYQSPVPDQAVSFQPSKFIPPPSHTQSEISSRRGRQTNITIIVVLSTGVIILAMLIYSLGSEGSNTSTSSNASPAKSQPNSMANSRNAEPSRYSTSGSDVIGKTGHLTTNQRIRSESHKNAEIIGVHYKDAKVEVLEAKSYTMEDGSNTTWYRVRVLENGCDVEENLGCGNDLNRVPGQAAMEGWMNAKNIRMN